MIIAGIDPGTQRAGYAVISVQGSLIEIKDLGYWNLLGRGPRPCLGTRLEQLAVHTRELFKRWNPHMIGFEKVVTFRNVASAHALSEARGVIRLVAYETLASASERFVELSPTSVKKEASGFGQASKEGVRRGLGLRFRNLESFVGESELSADAFDALAVAWTAWVLKGRYRLAEARLAPV